MTYIIYFLLSFIFALLITPLVKKIARHFQVMDLPGPVRKIHSTPVPLFGGVAVYFAFIISVSLYLLLEKPDFNIIPLKFFLAIIIGGAVLIFGGILDDKFNLPPKILWLFPAVASLIVVLSGIGVGITELTNPFGSKLFIGYNISFFIFNFSLSAILVWLWMMGMIFTTKLLDGLDGLCSGIALIGGLAMFAISLGEKINQPITASLAIIFCGAIAGYLIFAFNPASIFLGESGSTFLGFVLGILSIILGAKIATALLVMGIPILDVAWVIVRRLWYRQSPFSSDRKHLHFRLLDIGFSQKQTVLILYAISAIFGSIAVFFQSMGKLIALLVLFVVMLIIAITTVVLYKKRHPHIPDLFDYANSNGVDPVRDRPASGMAASTLGRPGSNGVDEKQ